VVETIKTAPQAPASWLIRWVLGWLSQQDDTS